MRLHRAKSSHGGIPLLRPTLLAVAVFVASCSSSTDGGDDNGGGGAEVRRVEGLVTFGGSGVGAVEVTLSGGPSTDRMATTGNDGSFVFNSVTPGNWQISFSIPNYFDFAPGQPATRPVVVVAGETSTANVALLPTSAGAEADVVLQYAGFYPDDITVTPGTVVEFTNEFDIAHTVTPSAHTNWEARNLTSPGQSIDITMNNPGVWNYLCTLHAGMTGVIRVEAP